MKTMLPYIVCGIFNPPYRKTEHFAHLQYFIIDVDHLSNVQKTPQGLKEELKNDDTVFMAFSSPGNDGLKIMFKLEEKCYDAAKYKLFYQEFALKLSKKYNLSGALDVRTSDVARACFLSYDDQTYFNPLAMQINIEPWVKNSFFQKGKEENEIKKHAASVENDSVSMDDDILLQIKQKLNPTLKPKEKNIFVPEELDQLMPLITEKLSEHGLTLSKIDAIHYGKKLKIELGLKWAEVNVFYGKKGYTVVKTPKNGSNAELCEIAYQIIMQLLQ
jgi:DNA polymerase I-like protein with 3'-5' exonuclease and polymerase domains